MIITEVGGSKSLRKEFFRGAAVNRSPEHRVFRAEVSF
jgi:hypothetical protein